MRFLSEDILFKMEDTPEFVKMLKHVLKYEVQILLQRLAEAGEESLVITVNLDDKSHGCLGSEIGKGYSQDLHTLHDNFLQYCIDKCKDKQMLAAQKEKKQTSELSSVVDLTNFSLELLDSDTQSEPTVTGSKFDHISVNIEPETTLGKKPLLSEEQHDGFPSEKDPGQNHYVENVKEIEVPTVVKNEDGEIFYIDKINDEANTKGSESQVSITSAQIGDQRDSFSLNSEHSEIDKYSGNSVSHENSPCHGSESSAEKRRRISVELDDLQPFQQLSTDPTSQIQQSQTESLTLSCQSQNGIQTIFQQSKSGTQNLSYQSQTGTENNSPQSERSTGKNSPKSSNGSAVKSCNVTDMSEMIRFYAKEKKSSPRQFLGTLQGSAHSGSEYVSENTIPWQRFSDTKSDDYPMSDNSCNKNSSKGVTLSESTGEDNNVFGTSAKCLSSSNQSLSSVRFENQSMLTSNDQCSTQSLNRHASIDRQQENQASRSDSYSCHGNIQVMPARKRSCEFSHGQKPQEILQRSQVTSPQKEREKTPNHLQQMSHVKRDKETDSDVFVVDLTCSNKSEARSSCDKYLPGNSSEQQMKIHKQRMSSDTTGYQQRCQPQYRVASAERSASLMHNTIESFGQTLVSPTGIYQRSPKPNERMQSNMLSSSPKNSVQFSPGSLGHQQLSGTMATSQAVQTVAQRNPMFASTSHINRTSPQGMTTSKNIICDAMATTTPQGQGQLYSAQRGQLEGIQGANIQHLGLNPDAHIINISGMKTNRAKFDESTFVLIGNMAKCLLCNKILKNKMSRRYHWRYHMGEKPYKCKYCEQRFGHPSNLVTHTRTHTRPFQCIHCSAKFARRTELEKHNADRHSNM